MKFIKFPWKVYKNDLFWVPPLISEVKTIFDEESYGDTIVEMEGYEAYYKLADGAIMEVTFGTITTAGEWLTIAKTQVEKDNDEITRLFLENYKG